MTKTLYLHIGLQKTGTSSIQMFFMGPDSPFHLAGIDILESIIAPRNAHHNVAHQMCNDKRYEPDMPGVEELVDAAHISPSDRLFVSSENFSFLNLEQITELKTHLKDFNVQILLCIRNQLSWIESLYAQAAKRGQVKPFDKFADMNFENDKLNYAKLLLNWMTVFGDENTHVIVYEHHRDINEAIADFFGVTITNPPTRKNQSLNERFVSASQAFIAECRSGKLVLSGKAIPPEELATVSRRQLAIGTRIPQFVGSPVFLDHEAGQAFLDRCRDINLELSAKVKDLPEAYFKVSSSRRLPLEASAEDLLALRTELENDPVIRELITRL